jgi:two-component system LytT family response regulator|tara:strand:+ start:159 stop:500 length:342 start_codon:yes stop_codon:yes gene_type:complete
MKEKTQIAVKTANSGIKIILLADILYLKSEGRCTIINLKNNTSLVASKNLGIYEEFFYNLNFIRVHNSYIVNFQHLDQIIRDSGSQHCVLFNNKMIPISNRKFSKVKEHLHYQ